MNLAYFFRISEYYLVNSFIIYTVGVGATQLTTVGCNLGHRLLTDFAVWIALFWTKTVSANITCRVVRGVV